MRKNRGLRLRARLRLSKRKKRKLALKKQEAATLKLLQSMNVGDIEKVTLEGKTFFAHRREKGFEFSDNPELTEIVERVGTAFDTAIPKFETEAAFNAWRESLPKWYPAAEMKQSLLDAIIELDEQADLEKQSSLDVPQEIDKNSGNQTGIGATNGERNLVASMPESVIPIIPPPHQFQEDEPRADGIAEAFIDTITYGNWMASIKSRLAELGVLWGHDINASVDIAFSDKPMVKVRWKALTEKGNDYLHIMVESLKAAQIETKNNTLESSVVPKQIEGPK